MNASAQSQKRKSRYFLTHLGHFLVCYQVLQLKSICFGSPKGKCHHLKKNVKHFKFCVPPSSFSTQVHCLVCLLVGFIVWWFNIARLYHFISAYDWFFISWELNDFKKIYWKAYLKILRLCLYVNKVYYHVAISVGLRGMKKLMKKLHISSKKEALLWSHLI